MTHEPVPALIQWHVAVRQSGLSQFARHVLLTLAGHVDGKGREALAWPSMDTIAAETAISRRKVQDAIRELEAAGIVAYARKSLGRDSHRFRLNLSAVRTRTNPAPGAGLRRPSGAVSPAQLGTGCQVTRHGVLGNPARGAELPGTTCRASNNHPSIDLAKELKSDAPRVSDGMDGPNKPTDPNGRQARKAALHAAGVKGPNATRLAAEESITPALIRSEAERIRLAPGIRNGPAALTAALAAHADVKLGSGKVGKADLNLSPDQMQDITRIENRRRRQQETRMGEAS